MKCLLWAVLLAATVTPQRPSGPEPWYERVLDRINPEDTDYGAIWEEQKEAFLDAYVRNSYFQYGVWSTALNGFMLLALYLQRLSHRRSMEVAVQALADMQRYDEYVRDVAREAIRRYNDHIEKCNRSIEASESGELEAARAEIEHLKQENRSLQRQRDNAAMVTPEMPSQPPDGAEKKNLGTPGGSSGKQPTEIDKRERDLHEKRKKKPHVKGPAFDAHHH